MNKVKHVFFAAGLLLAITFTASCSQDDGGTSNSDERSKLIIKNLPTPERAENEAAQLYQLYIYKSGANISSFESYSAVYDSCTVFPFDDNESAGKSCLQVAEGSSGFDWEKKVVTENFTLIAVENGKEVTNNYIYVRWAGSGTFPVLLCYNCINPSFQMQKDHKWAMVKFTNGYATVDYRDFVPLTP